MNFAPLQGRLNGNYKAVYNKYLEYKEIMNKIKSYHSNLVINVNLGNLEFI